MAIEPAATSARPAVTMIAVVAAAEPDNPAASAKGTVSPSDMPITTSRTASVDLRWYSLCGWWAIDYRITKPPHGPGNAVPARCAAPAPGCAVSAGTEGGDPPIW